MSVRKKIVAVIDGILQLGHTGVKLRSNAGVFEARNAANNAFVSVKALDISVGSASALKIEESGTKITTNATAVIIDNAGTPIELSKVVPATIYYVDVTSGNDANGGLSAGNAFQHIQFALDKFNYKILSGNCKIRVIAGNYSAEATLDVLDVLGSLTITAFDGTNDVSALGDTYIIDSIAISRCLQAKVSSLIANSASAVSFWSEYSCCVFDFCKSLSASAYGIFFWYSTGSTKGCHVANKTDIALVAKTASFVSSSDWTAGAGNNIGIFSEGSTVCKNGTQPQGTTAESLGSGGVIR